MFKKYHSIHGSNQKKNIYGVFNAISENQECVATEKADGCNFQVYIEFNENNKKIIKYGRRNDYLLSGEKLTKDKNDWENLMEIMKPKFNYAAEIIRAKYPDIESVIFYGELIGPVYKRVNYGDILTFYGFDIFTDKYLDFYEMCEIYKEVDILHSVIIKTGKFNDLIQMNPDYESEIGKILCNNISVPNISEGVVIIPIQNKDDIRGNRCIIKHKSSKFIDIKIPKIYKKIDNTLNEKSIELINWLSIYNTTNRIIDTKSKNLSDVNPKKICYITLLEIINEVEIEYNVKINDYPEKKKIINHMMREIQQIYDNK